MPSRVHRLLVQLLVPRLHALGYTIVASDQYYHELGPFRLKVPPVIVEHQPDLVGIRTNSPRLCIGEAKTAPDLRTRHTREQLLDFVNQDDAMLVVAFPAGAILEFERLLLDLGLTSGERIQGMGVPEALLA
jgi:hypothetical protein